MKNCPKCDQPIPEGYSTCPSCNRKRIDMTPEVLAHINLLKKKISTEPSSAKIHIDLGDIYHKQSLLDEALHEYEKALNIEPKNYNALIKSAKIYLKFKKLTKAEKTFRAALHINPRSTTSLIGLFRIYYLAGKSEEAIVLGEKIIKAVPDSLEFHMLLKNLYKKKGDKKKMLMEMQKIETLVPDNAEVLKEMLLFFMDENNAEKMKQYYRKLTDRNLVDVNLRFRIAKYYYDNQYYDSAIEYFSDILKQDGLTPELAAQSQAHLILIYFAKADISKSKKFMKELEPTLAEHLGDETKKRLAEVCYKIGQDKLKNNDTKKAVELFNKAIAYDPGSQKYSDALNNIKSKAAITNRNFIIKATIIAGGAIAVCILIILAITLTRNKIYIDIEPADNITLIIDGNEVEAQADRSGIIASPTLAIGSHNLQISKEGYETWAGSVDIPFGKSSRLELNLIPIYYSLQVHTLPESVELFIDGQTAGYTPFVSDSLLACSHRLTIQQRGYMEWDTLLQADENTDSIVMDTVFLKNLDGKWQGSIGQDSYAYNAAFDMTITQADTIVTIRFNHEPRDDNQYNGKINGYVNNNEFFVAGSITNRYQKVFYWAKEKKNIVLQGNISEDWDRIEGKYQIEGLADQTWWAVRSQ